MTDDAKAILLLCGRLDKSSGSRPLLQREYMTLVQWLVQHKLTPADLLESSNVDPAAKGAGLPAERLAALLQRGVQLGFAVEKWESSGIWVICRSDPDYPRRMKKHLKEKAPPILFAAGERSLLQGGGLAIVGSRNVDTEGEAFTRDVATWCARGGTAVVSGGARGVDQISMKAALDAGGSVIGVLAENLLKKSVARDARYAISDGRLLLLSPYHPEARFTVGTAMGRNKLIYAMADYGLVVRTDHKKGGTWEGATEELRRKQPRPVFVRLSNTVPIGNKKLLDKGALGFPLYSPNDDPQSVLKRAAENVPEPGAVAADLFAYAENSHGTPAVVKEGAPQKASVERPDVEEPLVSVPPSSIFEAVLPVILAALIKPMSADELAVTLNVGKRQLQDWLKRGVSEKRIKKLTRPVRYSRR